MGTLLIVIQLYKYFFKLKTHDHDFSTNGLFFQLGYIVGFNFFILCGLLFLWISFRIDKIKKRDNG